MNNEYRKMNNEELRVCDADSVIIATQFRNYSLFIIHSSLFNNNSDSFTECTTIFDILNSGLL